MRLNDDQYWKSINSSGLAGRILNFLVLLPISMKLIMPTIVIVLVSLHLSYSSHRFRCGFLLSISEQSQYIIVFSNLSAKDRRRTQCFTEVYGVFCILRSIIKTYLPSLLDIISLWRVCHIYYQTYNVRNICPQLSRSDSRETSRSSWQEFCQLCGIMYSAVR